MRVVLLNLKEFSRLVKENRDLFGCKGKTVYSDIKKVKSRVCYHKVKRKYRGKWVTDIYSETRYSIKDGILHKKKAMLYNFMESNLLVKKDYVANVVLIELDHEYKKKLIDLLINSEVLFSVLSSVRIINYERGLITGNELKEFIYLG